MIDWLHRVIVGPIGRSIGILLFASFVWVLWFAWPERPIATRLIRNTSGTFPKLALDGNTVIIARKEGDETIQPVPGQNLNFPENRVQLVDLTDGRELLPDQYAFVSVLFNNKKYLAVSYADFRVDVFETSDGKLRLSIPAGKRRVYRRMQGSESSPLLVLSEWSGNERDTSELWDIEQKQLLIERPGLELTACESWIMSRSKTELLLINPNSPSEMLAVPPIHWMGMDGWNVHPNGKSFVYCSQDRPPCDVTLFLCALPDFKIVNEFTIKSAQSGVFIGFSPQGRFLRALHYPNQSIWDLASPMTKAETRAPWGVTFAPDDSSLLISDRNKPSSWQLMRAGESTPIRSGCEGPEGKYSSDSKWLVMGLGEIPRPPTPINYIRSQLHRLLGIDDSTWTTVVVDTHTGQFTRRVPDDMEVGFASNSQCFWTFRTSTAAKGPGFDILLAQWPTIPPPPPWWLWFFTAACSITVALVLFRRRTGVRARLASPIA